MISENDYTWGNKELIEELKVPPDPAAAWVDLFNRPDCSFEEWMRGASRFGHAEKLSWIRNSRTLLWGLPQQIGRALADRIPLSDAELGVVTRNWEKRHDGSWGLPRAQWLELVKERPFPEGKRPVRGWVLSVRSNQWGMQMLMEDRWRNRYWMPVPEAMATWSTVFPAKSGHLDAAQVLVRWHGVFVQVEAEVSRRDGDPHRGVGAHPRFLEPEHWLMHDRGTGPVSETQDTLF